MHHDFQTDPLPPLTTEEKQSTGLSEQSLDGAITTGPLDNSQASHELRQAFKDAPFITEATMEALRQATQPASRLTDAQLGEIGAAAVAAEVSKETPWGANGETQQDWMARQTEKTNAIQVEYESMRQSLMELSSQLAEKEAELERLRWRPVSVRPTREDADKSGQIATLDRDGEADHHSWESGLPAYIAYWRPIPPPPAPSAEEESRKEFEAAYSAEYPNHLKEAFERNGRGGYLQTSIIRWMEPCPHTQGGQAMKRKFYYEIICGDLVIGTCTSEGVKDVSQEEPRAVFGLLSKSQYNNFGDDGWERPISTQRYKIKIERHLQLIKP